MSKKTLSQLPQLDDFLHNEHAATIAVSVDDKGTLHAATLLFLHTPDLRFYFVTNKNSEKCRLLHERGVIPCAVVVGTYKHTPFTVQMRGEMRIVVARLEILEAYYRKRGNRHDDMADAKNVMLEFIPNWRGTLIMRKIISGILLNYEQNWRICFL